jgi:hypothetical protein
MEIKNQNQTEENLWAEIRRKLREPIKAAFQIICDFEGAQAYGEVYGFDPVHKKARIAEIQNMPAPKNIVEFLERLRLLKIITSVPVEIYPVYNRFLAQHFFQALPVFRDVAAQALALAEVALADARKSESKMFESRGLPHQATAISNGPESVVARLKGMLAKLSTAHQTAHAPAVHPNMLAELFVDEVEAEKNKIAAMIAEANQKSIEVTGKPIGDTLTFEESINRRYLPPIPDIEALLNETAQLRNEHAALVEKKNALIKAGLESAK